MKYEHFYAMKPPTFEEAKEPLAADAWIRAIEAKFSVFMRTICGSRTGGWSLPCVMSD
jgi:hypothetical protein